MKKDDPKHIEAYVCEGIIGRSLKCGDVYEALCVRIEQIREGLAQSKNKIP